MNTVSVRLGGIHRIFQTTVFTVALACAGEGRSTPKLPVEPPPEAAKTGTIVVVVRGLPTGTAADIDIGGPSFSRHLMDSVTLDNLPAGSYTLTAHPVENPRYRFAAGNAVQNFVISRLGETQSAIVDYSPASGQLAISLVGLRSDVSAAIDVSSTNGFAQHLVGADTLWRLAPGTYSVVTTAVARGSIRYDPDTLQRAVVVTNGQTIGTTLRFRPSAALSIDVSGLPSGTPADADFVGAGLTRHVSGSTTIPDLPLASYTLSARDVTIGSEVYRAPAAQTLTLTEDGPFATTVRYARQAGRLTLNLIGLPQALGAPDNSVAVIWSPDGKTYTVSQSTTLNDLPMGDYRLIASQALYGGAAVVFQTSLPDNQMTFRLDPSHPDFAITLPFVFLRGAYDVVFTNVPTGVPPFLSVTGPNGFVHWSQQNETVIGVQPGTYNLGQPITLGTNPNYYRNDPLPATITFSAATPRVRVAVNYHPMVWATVSIVLPGLPAGMTMPVYFNGDIPQAPVTLTHIFPERVTTFAPVAAVLGDTAAWIALNTQFQFIDLAEGANTISFPVRQTNVLNVTLGLSGAPLPQSTVVITGPNNVQLSTGGKSQWTNLPPGQYTIRASTLTDGTRTWTPSVALQVITLPTIGHVDVNLGYRVTP